MQEMKKQRRDNRQVKEALKVTFSRWRKWILQSSASVAQVIQTFPMLCKTKICTVTRHKFREVLMRQDDEQAHYGEVCGKFVC